DRVGAAPHRDRTLHVGGVEGIGNYVDVLDHPLRGKVRAVQPHHRYRIADSAGRRAAADEIGLAVEDVVADVYGSIVANARAAIGGVDCDPALAVEVVQEVAGQLDSAHTGLLPLVRLDVNGVAIVQVAGATALVSGAIDTDPADGNIRDVADPEHRL